MEAAKRRAAGRFAVMIGVLVVVVIVVGIMIHSHLSADSSVVGGGSAPAWQNVIASPASSIAGGNPKGSAAGGRGTRGRSISPTPTKRGTASGSSGGATPTPGKSQPTALSTLPRAAVSPTSPGVDPSASVVVCTSADFDQKLNVCAKADADVSAGNGGLTVDGDVSFPDYMTGTISLLHKNGTNWQRLGAFSTKTYPDVVVIDSNKFISVQLANVFTYGGHRAMPACSSSWGIEVDDAQGLPLGDAMFVYVCK